MKVDGKEAHVRTQGITTIIAWAGGIAMKQHETVDDAADFVTAEDAEFDMKSTSLESDGFILSPLAVP